MIPAPKSKVQKRPSSIFPFCNGSDIDKAEGGLYTETVLRDQTQPSNT